MPDDVERMFVLPPLSDTEYWENFHAAGLNNPDPPDETNHTDGYTWINLTSPQYATPPAPPAIQGILYAGRRHVISGPPESTKTLIAYMLLLEALRQGEGVCILDFEMGPHAAATLLRELGASTDELEAVRYTEPDGPPSEHDIARIVGLGVGYSLVDAAAGAYDVTGLDDNSRRDAEKFATQWIRPLWQNGIATIVIDHVVKNVDSRGKFAIGSERKTGQADVHLSLESLKQLNRGGNGLVKIHVHKDRPGHLPRPTAIIVDLQSDPETHHIEWHLREPEHTPEGEPWRPTILMGRVSEYLERQTEPVSRNNITTNVKGNDTKLIEAVEHLIALGFATEEQGERGAKNVVTARLYTPENDLRPTSASLPPGGGQTTSATSAFHPFGVEEEADVDPAQADDLRPAEKGGSQIDVFDPAVQAMLDDPRYNDPRDKDIPF